MTSDQSHWTDADRDTQPEACHLCHTENVPLTNYSRLYGFYQGPHWLCALCENTQAGSILGSGGALVHPDWISIIGDVAALLHALRTTDQ